MIAVDTSALMAILLDEPHAERCMAALEAESEALISAGTVAEALIVAAMRNVAALNFGDCFAYDLAKQRDCPLLYVGNDFARTDIRSAV